MNNKYNLKDFLVYLLFGIFSIWPLGAIIGFFIANFTYCKISEYICSGYNEGWILPFWILGIIIVNLIFHLFYNKYVKKNKK